VADLTYVSTWSGFVYVAFVVDCFSRAIVGWHASTVKDTAMVTTALKMALWRRDHGGVKVGEDLIHHSDAGNPANIHLSRLRKPLFWKALRHQSAVSAMPTTALAETTVGLFKTEAVSKRSPFLTGPIKTIDDIEFATMGRVDWFNQRRLRSTLNYITPDESEAIYYSQQPALHPEMSQP